MKRPVQLRETRESLRWEAKTNMHYIENKMPLVAKNILMFSQDRSVKKIDATKLKLDYKKVDRTPRISLIEKNVQAYRSVSKFNYRSHMDPKYSKRVNVGKVPSTKDLHTIPSQQSSSTTNVGLGSIHK